MLLMVRNVDILAEPGRKCLALAASVRAADVIKLSNFDRCRPVPSSLQTYRLDPRTVAQALNAEPINEHVRNLSFAAADDEL